MVPDLLKSVSFGFWFCLTFLKITHSWKSMTQNVLWMLFEYSSKKAKDKSVSSTGTSWVFFFFSWSNIWIFYPIFTWFLWQNRAYPTAQTNQFTTLSATLTNYTWIQCDYSHLLWFLQWKGQGHENMQRYAVIFIKSDTSYSLASQPDQFRAVKSTKI